MDMVSLEANINEIYIWNQTSIKCYEHETFKPKIHKM